MKKLIFTLLVLLFFYSSDANAQVCIAASDFGQGGYVYVPAKPGEDGTAALLKTSSNDQVAPWISTDMFTGGVSAFDFQGRRVQRNVLKMYVEGKWYPFGRGIYEGMFAPSDDLADGCESDKVYRLCNTGETATVNFGGIPYCTETVRKCPLVDCEPSRDNRANNSLCLPGNGKTLDKGPKRSNLPCCMDDGWGLYGLIALEKNNMDRADPNLTSDIAKTPPSYDFRTFRIAPLKSDREGKYFEVEFTEQCNLSASNNVVCLADPTGVGGAVIAKGRLYFQIRDRYYDDNFGFYTINVVSGVYGLRGFIEETIEVFKTQMIATSTGLYEMLTHDLKFISIVKAMLLLYVTLFGIMFAMGMIQATQAELVVRLMKLAIVGILISDQSFEFFNNYLFSLITVSAEEIAKIIYDSTLFYSDDKTVSKFLLPADASPLSVFDIFVKMLLSKALHIKIWSLVFVKWYVLMIPLLYVGVLFILMGIVRAVVIYVTAIVLMAFMLVIAPIFIAMILFSITRQLFDGWLKLFISTGMMMVVIAATLSILITLFMNQIENLFTYGVCWKYMISLLTDKVSFLNWFDIYFWYPSDMEQALDHLTIKNFFAFLLLAVIFKKVMEDIPNVIDTLASSHLKPFSNFADGASRELNAAISTGLGVAQAVPAYVLMDNALAQYAGEKMKGTDTYKRASKTWKAVKESKVGKGVSGVYGVGSTMVGTAINAPNIIDSAMTSNEQRGPGLFSKNNAMMIAGQAVYDAKGVAQSYKSGNDSAWYNPGITTEVKSAARFVGWSKE